MNNTITVNRNVYIALFTVVVLQSILLLGMHANSYFGNRNVVPPVPVPAPVQVTLLLAKEEARLVRSAITLVQNDIENGSLTDASVALEAFRSLLPSSAKDKVMKELGTPDTERMRDALDILERKIEVKNE